MLSYLAIYIKYNFDNIKSNFIQICSKRAQIGDTINILSPFYESHHC